MAKAGVVLKHEHVTGLDIREGFFSPEKKRENEQKGRQCQRCSLVLSNHRVDVTGAAIAASESHR